MLTHYLKEMACCCTNCNNSCRYAPINVAILHHVYQGSCRKLPLSRHWCDIKRDTAALSFSVLKGGLEMRLLGWLLHWSHYVKPTQLYIPFYLLSFECFISYAQQRSLYISLKMKKKKKKSVLCPTTHLPSKVRIKMLIEGSPLPSQALVW